LTGVVSAERMPLDLYFGFAEDLFMLLGLGLLPLNLSTVNFELKGEESWFELENYEALL